MEISTVEQLKQLRSGINQGGTFSVGNAADIPEGGADTIFVLTNDLDLRNESDWEPMGGDDVYAFRGTFDGNGHVIKNLTCKHALGNLAGLFGSLIGATVQDLGLVGGSITDVNFAGALAGRAADGSSIIRCYTTCTVQGRYGSGGLVGSLSQSTVTDCYTMGNVTAGVDTPGRAGGIAAMVTDSSLIRCYATGTVSCGTVSTGGVTSRKVAVAHAAGIAVVGTTTVSNCVYLGQSVTGDSGSGRIAYFDSDSSVAGNYAWTGALLKGSIVTDGNADNKDGENLVYDPAKGLIKADGTLLDWDALGYTEENGWEIPQGQKNEDGAVVLPRLKGQNVYSQVPLGNVKVSITVIYNANDGTPAPKTVTEQNYVGAGEYKITGNTFFDLPDGYEFNGWNTAQDGKGTAYTAGTAVPEGTVLTLYAQWKRVSNQSGTGSGGGSAGSTHDKGTPAAVSQQTTAGGSVNTGDFSMPILWILLLTASLCSICIHICSRRKQNK